MKICLIDGEGTVVAALSDSNTGSVAFYKLKYNTIKKAKSPHNFLIKCMLYLRWNYFITGNFKGIVEIWNTKDLNSIHEQTIHSNAITKIEVSPCGKFFVTASTDYSVVIMELETKGIITKVNLYSAVKILLYLKISSFLLIYCTRGFKICNLSTSDTNIIIQTKSIIKIAI